MNAKMIIGICLVVFILCGAAPDCHEEETICSMTEIM